MASPKRYPPTEPPDPIASTSPQPASGANRKPGPTPHPVPQPPTPATKRFRKQKNTARSRRSLCLCSVVAVWCCCISGCHPRRGSAVAYIFCYHPQRTRRHSERSEESLYLPLHFIDSTNSPCYCLVLPPETCQAPKTPNPNPHNKINVAYQLHSKRYTG